MMSSREQYLYLCDGCKFASGATAYRTETLKKYHGFDEDYKHVEDWPTWLRMLINGEKIYYAGFISLCHRDGGISHDKSKKVPKHVQEYYNDMIKVYKKEILGNLGKLKPREKAQALSAVTKKFLKGKVKPTDSHQLEDYRKKHTFVICAYKEIPYLEDCVKSLLSQTLKSEIIISTSTPNKFIKDIAKKYKIKLAINKGAAGHINDFCFAYKQAKTKYVTLCHQDDFYNPDFAEKIVKKMEKAKNPLIGFSDYYEIRDGKITKHNSVLAVKRILNFPLIFLGCFKFVRLANLSLGNAICAPAVTYNKELLEYPIKKSNFTSNIDWDSYDDFARRKGSFVYVAKPLLGHRIHTGSTTTKVIGNGAKQKEDYEMFLRYWPKPIAKLIVKLYGNSEKSNTLKERKKK